MYNPPKSDLIDHAAQFSRNDIVDSPTRISSVHSLPITNSVTQHTPLSKKSASSRALWALL